MEIESMLQHRPDKVALHVCVCIYVDRFHQSILQTFTDSLLKKKKKKQKSKPKHFGDTTVKQMGPPPSGRELQSSVHFIFSQTGIQHSL